MVTFVAAVQAFLFAICGTAVVALTGQLIQEKTGLPTNLVPRIMLFHFLVSLILGCVFVAAMHEDSPFLSFITIFAFLCMSEFLAMATGELTVLIPNVFAAIYLFVLLQKQRKTYSSISPWWVGIASFLASFVVLTDDRTVDDLAMRVSRYFDLDPSEIQPRSYLFDKGGLFHEDTAVPLVAGFTAVVMSYATR